MTRRHRCDSKKYEHNGETHTLVEWAEILGVTTSALRKRMQAGRPPDQVFAPDLRITSGERKYFRKYLRKLARQAEEREEANERDIQDNNDI